MNSEEQTAPPQGVAVVTTPEGEQHMEGPGPDRRRRRRRNRHRNRRHKHKHKHKTPQAATVDHTVPEDRPPQTEGTQLHQARQNHSTYDRDLHHRARGGTGYGYRRDVTQPESELRGDQLPSAILPSYAQVLKRAGITPYQDTVMEPTLTDAQQQEWEEQQMRQAHERDQQNPTDEHQ